MMPCSMLAGIAFGIFGLVLNFCLLSIGWAQQIDQELSATWERTVLEAEKEGRVTIYGTGGRGGYEPLFLRDFQKRFPKIRVTYAGASGSALRSRVMAERRAGKYLSDVLVQGITTSTLLSRAQALDPIRPALLLPEVLDKSKWWNGKYHYADPEGKYNFIFIGNVHGAEVAYNTRLVDPREFKSYSDFLDPKWKGKIVVWDPAARSTTSYSLRFLYRNPRLGPEFIRKFFGEMEPTLSRSLTQIQDWLAVGKFPIAFFIRGVEELAKKGLPVQMFDRRAFAEGVAVGASQGSVSLFKRAPHPNAAKVAINWLLSREGQDRYQKIHAQRGRFGDSMREDISKDMIPPAQRRRKDDFFMARAEWLNMTDAIKIAYEALRRTKSTGGK